MKTAVKITTAFLLLCLCTTAVSAQKQLPPSALPYTRIWPASLVKALQQQGYDTQTDVSGARPRSAELQLDSTKTFYAYGIPTPNDSFPLFRSTYSYPAADVKIEVNYQEDNGQWLALQRITYFYDPQERQVEVLAEMYDALEGDFILDSRLESFPRGDSPELVDSLFAYQWDPSAQDWVLLLSNLNEFDVNDHLLASYSTLDVLGTPFFFKDVYTYDALGDAIRIESLALVDGAEIPTGSRELTYQNHLPIEVVAFVPDGASGLLPQSRITYAYNGFQKETEVHSFEWDFAQNDWLKTQTTLNNYDSQQRLATTENFFFHNDGTEERERIDYSYVADEHLALESISLWDGTQYVLSDRTYYYYQGTSSTPNPISDALPLTLSPNPTTGMTRLNLDGQAIIRLYNTRGEMISSGIYQQDYLLNVADLPNGLYFVTARTEKGAYAGRLLKK
jgi:hypothetical protein